MRRVGCVTVALLASFVVVGFPIARASPDLSGLWQAERRFGPELRGTLTVRPNGEAYEAELGRFRVTGVRDGERIAFEFPGGRGAFRGRLREGDLLGHWYAPRLTMAGLSEASPVVLRSDGASWRGEVIPLDDGFTFFLKLDREGRGRYSAFLRNPERNLGVFYNLETARVNGDRIEFVGTWRGRGDQRVLLEGALGEGAEHFSISIPGRGGTYDFQRVDEDEASAFYPRGTDPGRYVYREPLKTNDGWATATLDEVGIDTEDIEAFVRSELMGKPDGVHAQYIDGVLIARHGKLVFEEYFHGFHRGRPHDTRSGSKSLASTLIGAAIRAGAPLSLDSLAYDVMYDGDVPVDVDPRARRMTLRHLLTMSSGYFCDDGDPGAPGNEGSMQEQQDQPDWYRYTLDVPMASEPGAAAVYCSSNPNLATGMLLRATGTPIEDVFQELVAGPLEIDRYHAVLQPTGEPYLGGGMYWFPRDFMKLGQLHLDGGVWNGTRVLSEKWARDTTSPLVRIGDRGYGYFWWIIEYDVDGRMLHAYYAAGNGGNIVVVVPEADLVIAFFGSNYSDRVMFRPQSELIPDFILPAVSLD
ncbi:MAG: serine hydrolase [Planctomycetota bacterium]